MDLARATVTSGRRRKPTVPATGWSYLHCASRLDLTNSVQPCEEFAGPRVASRSAMARRVLVVSADAPLTGMLMEVLTAAGYYGRCTASVTDLALQSFTPNAVILDIATTASSDDALLTALDVPVVAISSRPLARVPRSARFFLTVPVDVTSLLTVLAALCRPPSASGRVPERRAASRPLAGDIRPCPHCGDAMRFSDGDRESPAWICSNRTCRDVVYVRVKP